MAVMRMTNPFVEVLIAASTVRSNGLKVILHNRERVLVEMKGKAYLFVFVNADADLTPGKVKRRVISWRRVKNRNINGHIVVSRNSDLSPTLISLDGTNLPPKVAVVGDWRGKNQLVTSQIDSNMAHLLEIIGVSKGEIARNRKPKVSPRKPISRAPILEAAPTPVVSTGFERNLKKGMLVDAYQLEKRLGQGASAEVWCATVIKPPPGVQLSARDRVAIKFYTIPPHGSQTIRIQREFDLAANTGHKHLARVHDLVISPSRPFHTFIVMEFVDGPTLKSFIGSIGKLSPLQTALIGIQLFEGLAELHSLDALHRDVKAANIMMSKHEANDLEIKLVDLGIISISNDTRLTAHSVFLGSKHSAPIEQLIGGELDQRTDIYGAGSVLYHCLKGKPMYDGVGPEAAIAMEMISSPQALSDSYSTNSAELELFELINSCISVEKTNRPVSVEKCLELLRPIQMKLTGSQSSKPSERRRVIEWTKPFRFSVNFQGRISDSELSLVREVCDMWVQENSFQIIGFSRSPSDPGQIDIEVNHKASVGTQDMNNRLQGFLAEITGVPVPPATIISGGTIMFGGR